MNPRVGRACVYSTNLPGARSREGGGPGSHLGTWSPSPRHHHQSAPRNPPRHIRCASWVHRTAARAARPGGRAVPPSSLPRHLNLDEQGTRFSSRDKVVLKTVFCPSGRQNPMVQARSGPIIRPKFREERKTTVYLRSASPLPLKPRSATLVS